MPKKVITKKTVKKTVLKKEAEVKFEKPVVEIAAETPKTLISDNNSMKPVARERYYEAVGRRKESVARVRMYTKKASDTTEGEKALITVNGKNYREYFTDIMLWEIVESPLKKLKSVNRFKATVIVRGGGKSGQADAIKHGLARTLVLFDQNFRKKLKKSGYLTRDSRAKERRKYGLKKARKAPRWAKR